MVISSIGSWVISSKYSVQNLFNFTNLINQKILVIAGLAFTCLTLFFYQLFCRGGFRKNDLSINGPVNSKRAQKMSKLLQEPKTQDERLVLDTKRVLNNIYDILLRNEFFHKNPKTFQWIELNQESEIVNLEKWWKLCERNDPNNETCILCLDTSLPSNCFYLLPKEENGVRVPANKNTIYASNEHYMFCLVNKLNSAVAKAKKKALSMTKKEWIEEKNRDHWKSHNWDRKAIDRKINYELGLDKTKKPQHQFWFELLMEKGLHDEFLT